MAPVATLALTREQVALLAEALDSHAYWQMSDPERRESGVVQDPTDAEQAVLDLQDQLETLLRECSAQRFLLGA